MTDDEIVSLADELGIAYINEGNVINFARALLSASIADTAEPLPVYQIAFSDEDGWCDTYKAIYDKHPEHMRRTLYMRPVAPLPVESIADTAGAKYESPVTFDKWADDYGFYDTATDVHQYARACAKDAWEMATRVANYPAKPGDLVQCEHCEGWSVATPPAPSSDTAEAKPVAQWQTKLREPILPECDTWINVSEEGARMTMEKWPHVYEVRALVVAATPASSGDTAGAKPDPLVTLSGAQLLEAFNFVAPDHPNDPDQLECEVTIAYGEGHSGEGHYCWITDYPEEGAILLDGKQAQSIATPLPLSREFVERTTTSVESEPPVLGAAIAATPASSVADAVREKITRALHYPDCWDTAAYPTLDTAILESMSNFICSTCLDNLVGSTGAPSVADAAGASEKPARKKLCTGSHVFGINGYEYCLGAPSCSELSAKESGK